MKGSENARHRQCFRHCNMDCKYGLCANIMALFVSVCDLRQRTLQSSMYLRLATARLSSIELKPSKPS